tara:strand:+ start:17902 stop:18405 length:504 start_codon:yes stop_codon:yes gene_type:complete
VTAWLILLVLTVILPALGIGPIITHKPGGARNNPIRVNLPVPPTKGNYGPGVRAQEVTDYVHRWLGALLIVLPLPFFVDGVTGSLLVLLAAFVATLWSEAFSTHFELVGHGAEIIVAERDGLVDYRAGEIERMQTRDGTFRGWSAERIDEALRKREWISRLFVKLYA